MTPELGQGGCAALEDGDAFADGKEEGIDAALERYAEAARYPAS
jgi:hypothetical protein